YEEPDRLRYERLFEDLLAAIELDEPVLPAAASTARVQDHVLSHLNVSSTKKCTDPSPQGHAEGWGSVTEEIHSENGHSHVGNILALFCRQSRKKECLSFNRRGWTICWPTGSTSNREDCWRWSAS